MIEAALFGLVAGFGLASWLANRRWRENAGRIQRIESGGQLYKVLPADVYDGLVESGAPVVPGEHFKAHTQEA